MNFLAFRYFNEVAKVKSIRRAADRLHIAPSAVSRQLMQLEHSLGTPLLERTNIGVELTQAGVIVEQYTRGMFRDLAHLQALIQDFKNLNEGEVSLWVIEGIISNFLPRVMADFNRTYPAILFSVQTDSTDRIIEALIRNEADIGVVFNAKPRPEIEIIAEHTEPVMCLMAKDHEFANRSHVSLQEICTQPVALPLASFGLRRIFEAAVLRQKLEPRVSLTSNTLELTKTFASAGNAVTISPLLAAVKEVELGTLVAVPISDPEFSAATAAICTRRDRPLSYAAAAFLRKLAAAFKKLGQTG